MYLKYYTHQIHQYRCYRDVLHHSNSQWRTFPEENAKERDQQRTDPHLTDKLLFMCTDSTVDTTQRHSMCLQQVVNSEDVTASSAADWVSTASTTQHKCLGEKEVPDRGGLRPHILTSFLIGAFQVLKLQARVVQHPSIVHISPHTPDLYHTFCTFSTHWNNGNRFDYFLSVGKRNVRDGNDNECT